jgi:hypothetical protein
VTLSDILTRFGWRVLAQFTGLSVLYLALRLLRLPFVAVLAVLAAGTRAIDRAVSARITPPPTPPSSYPPGYSRWRTA